MVWLINLYESANLTAMIALLDFRLVAVLFVFFVVPSGDAALQAQDTVRVSFQEFLEHARERAPQLQARQREVELAQNRLERARGQRILPQINLTTAHGLVPGVQSDRDGLSPGQYYLDPDLSNDWEDWGIFTHAELSAIQPLYTWGAIDNAIQAAEAGARASEYEFASEESDFAMQLYELYYGHLLTRELQRILEEAEETFEEADQRLNEMQEEGHEDLEQADIFQFEIFRHEFRSQAVEVRERTGFVRRNWELVMDAPDGVVYVPQEEFLDPVDQPLESITWYKQQALQYRDDMQRVEAGVEAAEYGMEAARAQYYPSLFIGIQGRAAYTPNRPRQTNPFIINNSNYATGEVGFGIRQNLNFAALNRQVERSRIHHRQSRDARDAVEDGMMLEINEAYQDANVARARMENTRQALQVSGEWLRTEQIDMDLGFGDVENLVDAVKSNLELEVEYHRKIHEFNLKMARLYHKSGLPLLELYQ